MLINFRTLSWKNFLSAGMQPTVIDFNASKTTLIMGENGAGKSTLLDALTFALYNKPFRKINKGQMVNSINRKECEVTVEFEIKGRTYKVVRGIKPNVFDIFEDGTLINKEASKDYQEVLEQQILHVDYKTFCQLVVIGNAGYVPFMQLPALQRRELIDTLLDLQVLTTMGTILKERVNENKKDVQFVSYKIDTFNDKMALQRGHIATLRKGEEDREEEIRAAIVALEQENEEEPSYEADVAGLRAERESLDERMQKIRLLHAKLTGKRRDAHLEAKYLEDTEVCRQCGQPITEEHKQKHLTEAKEQLAKLDPALAELDTKQRAVEARQIQVTTDLNFFLEIDGRIKNRNRMIASYDAALEKLKTKEASTDLIAATEALNKMLSEQNEAEAKQRSLTSSAELYQMATSMLKDTGIKAKIIANYIGLINAKINGYLETLNLFVQFELDENFEETIKSRYRDEFSYASFSEGEKARIDLAILLTWRDIATLRNSVACNILIFDEVFDGSLNAEGEYLLMQIFRSTGHNVIVISHKDAKVDWFDRTLRFEKVNNFSQIGV